MKDVDFERAQVTVRQAKGRKERYTTLPRRAVEPLAEQLERARRLHRRDLAKGYRETLLPDALARKLGRASRDWSWQ